LFGIIRFSSVDLQRVRTNQPRPLRVLPILATNAAIGFGVPERLQTDLAKETSGIQKRVAEIQSMGAQLAAITIETLIAEAEAARNKAMREKGGANAAVAAITAKAKLAGLWREKVAQTDPSGENAPRYIISDRPMTEEEWIRERCGE
jgi:hypothetical protein